MNLSSYRAWSANKVCEMSSAFDPYHKWLGISPREQPPNHYRLLAIDLYESDPEVIDSAANRQMSYLQELASGPNVRYAQKLLNEIAAARVCLLDDEQRARRLPVVRAGPLRVASRGREGCPHRNGAAPCQHLPA